MAAKFIVIEGIDGSGKGSQMKLLASYLFEKSKDNHVFITREPYHSKYYGELRTILKKNSDPKASAQLFLEMFVKDRRFHAAIMERYLEDGHQVICDRYKYSTVAFQQAQGLPLSQILKLHEGLLVPDLVVILDVPVLVALNRIQKAKRSHKEVFEKEIFLEQVRANYLAMSKVFPNERIIVVDGNKTPEAVLESYRSEVDKLFGA